MSCTSVHELLCKFSTTSTGRGEQLSNSLNSEYTLELLEECIILVKLKLARESVFYSVSKYSFMICFGNVYKSEFLISLWENKWGTCKR